MKVKNVRIEDIILAWVLKRAIEGDERVLAIAQRKAAEGNTFCQKLLEEVKKGEIQKR